MCAESLIQPYSGRIPRTGQDPTISLLTLYMVRSTNLCHRLHELI